MPAYWRKGMTMETKKELRGIGGWLLLFLISVTIFTPLNIVLTIALAQDSARVFGFNLFLIVLWIFGFYAAVRMWRCDSRGVYLMKAYLWILLVVDVLELSAHPNQRALFYPIVWLAFLAQSKRVRQTYGSNSNPVPVLAK
jgi:hypothetical protein